MFLNLSNHPSSTWSGKQRAAAEVLAGDVVDQLFPEVPPEATTEEVAEMAAAIARRITQHAPAAAMVQGEFTLAFSLVRELESRGIPCYAATTRRMTQSVRTDDGPVQRISTFEFVQFRRYR